MLKRKLWIAAGAFAALFLLRAGAETYDILVVSSVHAERVTAVSEAGHFPVMVRLENGDLVAAVRAGATHVGVKGRLDWIRSTDGGRKWTQTPLIQGTFDHRNPAVGQLRSGTVIVTYHVNKGYGPNGDAPGPDKPAFRDGTWILRSKDRGRTWDAPLKSPIPLELGASGYGKIVQLADGTALMAVYYLEGVPFRDTSLVYRSTDDGRTWGDPSHIASGFNETALAVLPNDRLIAVLRSGTGGSLWTSFSDDKGRSWTSPHQITGTREHPADVILLKDGRLLLTYGERNRPFGIRAKVSNNLGQDWDSRTIVLAADAENQDCGYPSSVETTPGNIVTLYYGVNGAYDPYGKDPESLSRSYAKAVLWSVPQ